MENKSKVLTCGNNYYGQLGLGDKLDRQVPTIVGGIENITFVSADENKVLALDTMGQVWIWGSTYSHISKYKRVITEPVLYVPNILSGIDPIGSISSKHNLILDLNGNLLQFADDFSDVKLLLQNIQSIESSYNHII